MIEAIVHHPGPLTLTGLESIPPALAVAIRQRTHSTVLPDVKILTEEAAFGLVRGGGVQGTVWLEGLSHVETGAVQSLLKFRPLSQGGANPDQRASRLIILPTDLRRVLEEAEISAIEEHESINFGNQRGP